MIPLFSVSMNPSAAEEISKVLLSGYIGEGEKVKEFELRLQNMVGNKNILTLNSGTSALHLALHMSGVKGKRVISSPMTCSATNFPILSNWADILWADIDPLTGNIDPNHVSELLAKNDNVGAIVCVHWGGYPCDLDELTGLGERYGIPVIEDAAHGFGSMYKKKPIGNHSDFVMFSFQAIKHLTTVDGGALCCKNWTDYSRAKLLRWYGIDRDNFESRCDLRCEADIFEAGWKFHMNDVCAAVGISNLEIFHDVLSRHQTNSAFYDCALEDMPDITLLKREEDRQSACWLYTMRVKDRDNFMLAMKSRGVMTSKVHARNDLYSCTSKFKKELPNLDLFYSEMVSIPVGNHITVSDRHYIVDSIKKGW